MAYAIAMIPARLGSQRLKKKNLRELDGIPLITRAIRKCEEAGCFDEIWVNSESQEIGEVALAEGARFHQRPVELGDNKATSEDFVDEFLRHRQCSHLLQVHSIAPLLSSQEVKSFAKAFVESDYDCLLSCIHDQIECAYQGKPINFHYGEKENSQNLIPIQRVTWSITGWKADAFLAARDSGECATYSGKVGYYEVSNVSGHVIKTETDLQIASALLGAFNHGS